MVWPPAASVARPMFSGAPRARGSPGTRSPLSPSSAAGADWTRPPGSRLGPGRLRSRSRAWAATRATAARSGSRTHGSHLSVVAVERPRDDGTGRVVGGGRALARGDRPRSAGFWRPAGWPGRNKGAAGSGDVDLARGGPCGLRPTLQRWLGSTAMSDLGF